MNTSTDILDLLTGIAGVLGFVLSLCLAVLELYRSHIRIDVSDADSFVGSAIVNGQREFHLILRLSIYNRSSKTLPVQGLVLEWCSSDTAETWYSASVSPLRTRAPIDTCASPSVSALPADTELPYNLPAHHQSHICFSFYSPRNMLPLELHHQILSDQRSARIQDDTEDQSLPEADTASDSHEADSFLLPASLLIAGRQLRVQLRVFPFDGFSAIR